MSYFGFVTSEIHGLRIHELTDHKAAGGKVVGTFCLYVPEEIIRALGAVEIGRCAGAEWRDRRTGPAYADEMLLPESAQTLGARVGAVGP